jgi:hypothetical protein
MKTFAAYALSIAVFAMSSVAANAAPPEKDTPPQASAVTAQSVQAVTLNLEHLNLSQTPGTVGSQWGLGAAGFFPFNPNWGLNIDGGLYTITNPGSSTVNGTRLQASLVRGWSQQFGGILTPAGRGGLSIGFQNNAISGLSTVPTWNYGGFIDLFPTQNFTISGKAGIVSKCAASNGYYLGAGATVYTTPDFSLKGAWDYSRFNAFGGSGETDYSLRAEYQLSRIAPLSLYGGYTRSAFSPATNFHVDTTTFGLNFRASGSGTTLVDRQRKGTLDNSTLYLGLQCRF